MRSSETFEIDDDLWWRVVDHLEAARPNEGCGLIACAKGVPVEIFPGTNTEASLTRYNMDPGEVVRAFDQMDREGWRLGAIFHSHPQSPAVPSSTDLRLAFYPDTLMLIVSLAGSEPVGRAYRLTPDGQGYCEVPLVIRRAEERRQDSGSTQSRGRAWRHGSAGHGRSLPEDH